LAQEPPEIREIAVQLSNRIERANTKADKKKKDRRPEVLIMPFSFSETVSSALATASNRYRIGDTKCLTQLLRELKLAEGLHLQPSVAVWLAKQCSAELVITLSAAVKGGEMNLTFVLLRTRDARSVGRFSKKLSWDISQIATTDEARENHRSSPSPTTQEQNAARAGVDGVGVPSCLSCPNPDFTEDAIQAEGFAGGTIVVRAVVTAEGRISSIHLVRGLPFGLNERSIKVVQSWKFRPALAGDGKPVAVWTTIEINFKQY
jgi:TonB family protein